jgi:hypothetical protein
VACNTGETVGGQAVEMRRLDKPLRWCEGRAVEVAMRRCNGGLRGLFALVENRGNAGLQLSGGAGIHLSYKDGLLRIVF